MSSALSSLRLVATIPPVEHFWGVNVEISRVHLDTLRDLGATVHVFDTSPFYRGDHDALRSQIDAVRSFKPDAAIALPNAGYAAELMVEDYTATQNVFLDVLELPTIFLWDHALIQAPRYVLPYWPSQPFYSIGGVKGFLRLLFLHPRAFHFFFDTGYISELRRLGIAEFGQDNCAFCGGVSQAFIEYGQSQSCYTAYRHPVSFFGNLHIGLAEAIRYNNEAFETVRTKALFAAMSDWNCCAYQAYLNEIAALDPSLRLELRLDPDQSFYWRYLHDELCLVANGELRFRKLLACGHPLTYFGGFAAPQSRTAVVKAGWQLADEHLPYGGQLAAAFGQSRVSIDVSNAPFINGFTSKFLECFAAGGFMLTSRKTDMQTVLGAYMDAIGFSSAEELAAKVDYYLSSDTQRLEVAREIQELVCRDWSTAALFARTIPLAIERLRALAPTPLPTRRTSDNVELQPQNLGPHLFDLKLEALKLAGGASGHVVDNGLALVTSSQRWAYGLLSPLLCDSGFAGEAVIRVRVTVISGRLGLAIGLRESPDQFVVELSANPSMHVRIIDIPIEDLARTGALVVRNQSGSGPSRATIRSVQVFRPGVTSQIGNATESTPQILRQVADV